MSVCVCSLMCVDMGVLGGVCENNIPAVFNIAASHTLLLTASGIKLPLGLLEEAPQSLTVLLPPLLRMSPGRPSFSLANILFSCCGLFAFLKKGETHHLFSCRY